MRSSKVNENVPSNSNKNDNGQHLGNCNIFFFQILEKFKTTIDKTQEQTTPLDNVSINGKNPCNCNVFIFYKNSN